MEKKKKKKKNINLWSGVGLSCVIRSQKKPLKRKHWNKRKEIQVEGVRFTEEVSVGITNTNDT